jgi:hypothetical protein
VKYYLKFSPNNNLRMAPVTQIPHEKVYTVELADGVKITRTWKVIYDTFMARRASDHVTIQLPSGLTGQVVASIFGYNGYIAMSEDQADFLNSHPNFYDYTPHGDITAGCSVGGKPGFGFDCGHYGDIQINPCDATTPHVTFGGSDYSGKSFKDASFVECQLRKWAEHMEKLLDEMQVQE